MSRNLYTLYCWGYVAVTPREGRVSRKLPDTCDCFHPSVAPREGRVSRNGLKYISHLERSRQITGAEAAGRKSNKGFMNR